MEKIVTQMIWCGRWKKGCNKYGQHKWYILKTEPRLGQMCCIAIFEFLAKSIYGEQLFQKENSKGRSVWFELYCRVSFYGSGPFDWVGIDIALIPPCTVHDLLIHHTVHTLVRQCLVFSARIYRWMCLPGSHFVLKSRVTLILDKLN